MNSIKPFLAKRTLKKQAIQFKSTISSQVSTLSDPTVTNLTHKLMLLEDLFVKYADEEAEKWHAEQ